MKINGVTKITWSMSHLYHGIEYITGYTPIGMFSICFNPAEKEKGYNINTVPWSEEYSGCNGFDDFEDAKTICQSIFQQKIMECLVLPNTRTGSGGPR